MSTIFPSLEWLEDLEEKLNTDEKYARVAKKWEGDMLCQLTPDDKLEEEILLYVDLWHGKCRGVAVWDEIGDKKPAFILKAVYGDFVDILQGKLDPRSAMFTGKLDVKGNIATIIVNTPTVLNFVRCAGEVTGEVV